MSPTLKTKLLAAFLVAFVCLNAGGALCVTYCRSPLSAVDTSEHCPQANIPDHFEGESGTVSTVRAIECCPMIAGFIPGPIDGKKSPQITPAASLAAVPLPYAGAAVISARLVAKPAYRGPPKEERELHLKIAVLLI